MIHLHHDDFRGAPSATAQYGQLGDGAEAQNAGNGAPHVLHVDGDGDSAVMLAALLVPETRVTHVQTLAAAIDAVAREHYALLVLDPDLPDGDGAALFEALRLAGAATPVLLYSAGHTVWRDQASAFLLKPWTSPRQLWNTVERLLRGSPAMWVERG